VLKLSRMGLLGLVAIGFSALGVSAAMPTGPMPTGMPTAAILPSVLPSTRPVASAGSVAKAVVGFEREVSALEAALKKTTPAPGGVLFYGSSSIRLWKTVKDDFPGMNVINHGFGGSTCPDAIKYFDRLVVPCRPSTIVFYEGDNDLGKGRTPEQLLADYQTFAKMVNEKLPGTKVLYLSVKPSPKRADLIAIQQKANRMLESWIKSRKDPRLAFINVFASMVDAQGKPRTELFSADKLHMNRDGYKLWVKVLGLLPASVSGSTPAPTGDGGMPVAKE
jgi:lysophospholipase L1-like esterase